VLRRVAGFNYFQSEWAHVAYLSGLSIIAATLSFYLLEKPVRAWGRRIAN
jgi:peptidoglycan/LPS O-acetylase OafA/YrhL